jgi:hypothetical protein
MRSCERLIVGAIVALTVGSAPACGSRTPAAPTAASVSSVAVTGASLLGVGQQAQLTAIATRSDGSTENVTTAATWISSNTTVVTVSAGGIAVAASDGDADIRATHQTVTGLFHIAVGTRSQSAVPVAPTPVPTPPMPAPTPPPAGMACGTERWAVKTLSDPDAPSVDVNSASTTTIAALNALTPHCSGLPEERTFREEFHAYEITGVVLRVTNDSDRDISLALADPRDVTRTMVVALVEPTCAGAIDSPFRSLLQQARVQYMRLGALTGRVVRVRGVGFYDFDHGQAGRSRSCIELHPVIAISGT